MFPSWPKLVGQSEISNFLEICCPPDPIERTTTRTCSMNTFGASEGEIAEKEMPIAALATPSSPRRDLDPQNVPPDKTTYQKYIYNSF